MGHDTTHYVIRLPDCLWQRLIDRKWAYENLGPMTLTVFQDAIKARTGSGHTRYITGDQRTLCRILARLHILTTEMKKGEHPANAFIYRRADIERWANQRLRLASDVNIIPVPETPEATRAQGEQ